MWPASSALARSYGTVPVFWACLDSSVCALRAPMATDWTPDVAFLIVTGRVPTYLPAQEGVS